VADVRPIELESDVEPVMSGEALLEEPESLDLTSDEEDDTEL
jgi:hypothetical protein